MEGLVEAGTRKLLRFTTEIRNIGKVDLNLGDPANIHSSFSRLATITIISTLLSSKTVEHDGQEVASSLKIGFCLEDDARWTRTLLRMQNTTARIKDCKWLG